MPSPNIVDNKHTIDTKQDTEKAETVLIIIT